MIAKCGSCTRVLRRIAYHLALAVLLVIPVEASGDTVTLFMSGPKTVREGDLVTQTVTFATNWAEGPDSSYSLSWEFATSDFSLLDPVIPNTEAGSRHFDVEGGPDGGGGCFIATATFGSHLDPHVQRLRWFRDETLMKNQFGRSHVILKPAKSLS